MIRRIYTAFFSIVLGALTLTSCSDWLDVYPSDQIKEEYLFSTGEGFRAATNGIYRKMSTSDMYGSNMTWGIVDAWGQSYYLDESTDKGVGKAMKKIGLYSFKHSELTPTTDAMWNAAWNVVANANELAQQAAVADPKLFYELEEERLMILAEAIGIRAFVQFDLLRIYAPAPASVQFKEDNRTFIPYIDSYPSYVNDHQTVAYCLGKIIADLTEAQRMLFEVDKNSDMKAADRFTSGAFSESTFSAFRGYRMNYYAITAALARVYLYAGKNAEAYAEAKKVIDKNKETSYFKASTSAYAIQDGNLKMYDDIIFALYSPTELVDWDHEMNHASDGSDNEKYLCIHKDIAKKIYDADMETDWRLKYQLELKEGYYYRALKYYEQPAEAKYAKVNNQTIPMIRMSEVYYIAAEAIFDTKPDEANEYMKLVKRGRGINSYTNVDDKAAFINLLVNDARREFFGEGQILYMHKRLNRILETSNPYLGEDMSPTDNIVVLPLPDSELSIK